ncbi:unnamed protein product, partial [Closterium sp. Naga37s-1]
MAANRGGASIVTRKLMHAVALLSLALAATTTTPRLLVAAAAAPPSPDSELLNARRHSKMQRETATSLYCQVGGTPWIPSLRPAPLPAPSVPAATSPGAEAALLAPRDARRGCNPTVLPEAALLALRDALRRSNPAALPEWGNAMNPCDPSLWSPRLKCNSAGRVISLNLANELLKGPIPGKQLAALAGLQRLGMGYNALTGPIPKELSALSNLTVLSLEGNQLKGPVPEWLGSRLLKLVNVRLANNLLSGTLPSTLGGFKNLQSLDLASNHLSGQLPSTLQHCRLLEHSLPCPSLVFPLALPTMPPLPVTSAATESQGSCRPASSTAVSCSSYPSQPISSHTLLPRALLSEHKSLPLLPLPPPPPSPPSPPSSSSLPSFPSLLLLPPLLPLPPPPPPSPPPFPPPPPSPPSPITRSIPANELSGTVLEWLGIPLVPSTIHLPPPSPSPLSLPPLPPPSPSPLSLSPLPPPSPSPLSLPPLPTPPSLPPILPVTSELYSNRLSGRIPPSLAGASALESIAIDDNRLSGPLPPALGSLPSLDALYLASNSLEGPIPATFKRLNSLMYLDLSYNKRINGSIPAFIGNLWLLESLVMEHCNLSGPTRPSLGGLSLLVDLFLSSNRLPLDVPCILSPCSRHPASYHSIEALPSHGPHSSVHRAIEHCSLTGPIPSSLGALSLLVEIFLSSNRLSGRIPATLGGLESLNKLYLSRNRLTGRIPAQLCRLSNSYELSVARNGLNGTIPTCLTALPRLKLLDVSRNHLTGSLPPIPKQSNLRFVYAEAALLALGMHLRGSSNPTVLLGWKNADPCKRRPSPRPPCPSRLSFLCRGREAVLLALRDALRSSNPGALPGWVNADPCDPSWTFRLKCNSAGRVISLNFATELLKAPIPGKQLAALADLQRLDMGYNTLTGPISKELSALSNLTFLSLEANQLGGPVPEWLGSRLLKLVTVRLADNRFNGTLPSTLGDLKTLQTLDLGSNHLSGQLPSTLQHCGLLQQ